MSNLKDFSATARCSHSSKRLFRSTRLYDRVRDRLLLVAITFLLHKQISLILELPTSPLTTRTKQTAAHFILYKTNHLSYQTGTRPLVRTVIYKPHPTVCAFSSREFGQAQLQTSLSTFTLEVPEPVLH
jgi:hypothetical protein